MRKKNQIFPLTLLILALIYSFYGVTTPPDAYISKKIGKYKIRPYKYGIYITDSPSGIFYNFSPYYSYFTDNRGIKNYLLYFDEEVPSEEYKIRNDPFLPKITSILSYFNLINPSATFKSKNTEVKLTSSSSRNQLVLKLDKFRDKNRKPQTIPVLALTVNESDFIFDDRGKLLSPKAEDDIQEFHRTYNILLHNQEESSESAKGPTKPSYIFIFNPRTSGILRTTNSKKDALITLDNQKHRLYFEGVSTKPEIILELFDTVGDAISTTYD
ncbi:hypothetical protein A2716_01680 [candidate division WWE3 bacterium RIFCSPHIGHO2_01_FULL_40_23]|uniref:Uncharacterized protein n=1 Tax=candidate division WWE3 bacterium RIFCSPLOWO2_01_FULL_41_18 TaxID=1802625 RepID=A0A1F4VG70_UNCKA|nr:MAG: hypothetical protein A2716_01680 [candidate division WWE3 bacterium RIFCSPHIGHO2_01_FULL_40_23]OGC55703.1 MAG: hypothetical protein A3A78_01530 [candidate division WWE3 bacterium RIFCSPLOWO2_01_FULL_41_18]